MGNENILQIVIAARDEASKTIGNIGNNLDKAGKSAMNMSAAFKIAGGVVLAAGIAGVGIMKTLADAASAHQTVMASVDATLKNVSQTMGTSTVVIGGFTTATTSSKKEIQAQIRALELQKSQLTLTNAETTQSVTVTTGHGKTLKTHTKLVHQDAASITAQKNAIDQQIISLKLSEATAGKAGITTGGVTKVIDNAAFSYKNLKQVTDDVTNAYIKLGFSEDQTAPAFAQDLRITGNITDARKMMATAADLARLKGIDLATATNQLTMGFEGQTVMLKRMGIELPKGAKGMEVLNAVTKASGGQAQAFAHTYEGASEVLSANFDKLKATLGDRLLPSFTQFTQSITSVIERLNNLSPATYDTIMNVLKFGTAFALIAGPILLVIGFLPTLQAGFLIMSGAILPLIVILGAVAIAGYELYTHWNQITAAFNQYKPTLIEISQKLEQLGTVILKKLQEAFIITTNFINQHKAAVMAVVIFLGTFLAVYTAINVVMGIGAVVMGIMTAAATAFGIVMAFITSPITLVALAITSVIIIGYLLITHWKQVQSTATTVWNGIMNAIKIATTSAGNWIKDFINGIINGINTLINGINSISGKLPGVGKNLQIPDIPHFDQGGYVPSTGLAMLHSGEFVLSKDMISGKQPTPSSVSTTNNSSPINIYATVNSNLDMNLLGQKIAFAVANAR